MGTKNAQATEVEQVTDEATPETKPAPQPKVKLATLEERIIEQLKADGVTAADRETVAPLGDEIVDAGRLDGYTAAKYGSESGSKWVSNGLLKRINRAIKPVEQPKVEEVVEA